ncbi:MAG: adenylate/guanylate cyclase domain-containing protein [Bacteroidota bacterium]
MKRLLLIIGLLLFCFSPTWTQTIQELEKELSQAKDARSKMMLNYQLAKQYLSKRPKKAARFARKAIDLAGDRRQYSMAAQASYIYAQSYLKQGDRKNAEVWFKSTLSYAKKANDPDLIIKSVDARSKLAIRERKYRRAYEINQEAFNYFSKQGGMSVSDMLNQLEIDKAKLEKDKSILERERGQLSKEIKRLTAERNQLSKDKSQLRESHKELTAEKEKVEQAITEKEEALVSISEEKEKAELLAQQRNKQVKELNRENLEQEYLLNRQKLDLMEAQSAADRNRLLWISALMLTLLLLGVAGSLYGRFRAKKKANRALEEKNKIIEEERERSDELLLNILPAPIAKELKEKGKASTRKYEHVSVMFSDFKNFTQLSERLSPEQLVKELDHCFKAFDFIISQYEIEKIKTIGDAYMCAHGLNDKNSPPKDIVRAALEIQEFLEDYKSEKRRLGLPYFEARIGIHTGPVVAGVVGVNKFAYDIWGETVNVAARMESACEIGRVNISEATYNKVKYNFDFKHRGKIAAKNVGEVDMYYVTAPVPVS